MRYAITAGLLGLGLAATALVATSGAEAASGVAPGAPGATALWTAGNKDGFGTATTSASKVWYTLGGGELTEVYYPNLGTPAIRDLQFVVTDGKSWIEREREDTDHRLTLVDPSSLSYQQINTDPNGRYRITKAYTTDPARSVLLMRVRFESLTNQPLRLYVLYDPSLSGNGDDDSGSTAGTALTASDAKAASALVAAPAFTKTSSGYLGTSDGWSDLRTDYSMDWNYRSAPDGNVAQIGRLELTGKPGSQDATLALGFGTSTPAALAAANSSLTSGFGAAELVYQSGWHRLPRRPPATFERGRPRTALRRLAHGARRLGGQDLSGRLHRLADHGLGLGPDPWLQRPLPPGVGARPLRDGQRRAGGR